MREQKVYVNKPRMDEKTNHEQLSHSCKQLVKAQLSHIWMGELAACLHQCPLFQKGAT